MSEIGLKGLLVGRDKCTVPENCDTTGWVDYNEMLKMYNKAKFIFLPNIADASPRVLTECLATNLACLVNKDIVGGWKYVTEQTGEFFTDENDIEESVNRLLKNMNKYQPRKYIIDNYGPINSGKKLKEYLYTNFSDKVNIPKNDVEYITLRHHLTDFKP